MLWESDPLYRSLLDSPELAQSKSDVKGIFYEGLPYKGKPTRVFAYIGVPKNAKNAPGIVLVHRGSDHYRLIDYFGRSVAEEPVSAYNGDATISVSGCEPGWYQLECKDSSVTESASVWRGDGQARHAAPRRRPCLSICGSSLEHRSIKISGDYARIVRLAGIPWVRELLIRHLKRRWGNMGNGTHHSGGAFGRLWLAEHNFCG